MKNRAQASLEYMVMLALSLGILASILYVVSSLITTSSIQIGLDSALRASSRIKEAADFIYVHGHPSKTQISVYIPPNVEEVSIVDNRSVNVRIAINYAYTDIYDFAKGTVVGDLSSINKEGYYVLSVESNPDNTINITTLV